MKQTKGIDMSTRFRIGYCDLADGSVVSIAGHWDGYPAHIGPWLFSRNDDLSSAAELVRGHRGIESVHDGKVSDMESDTRRVDSDIIAYANSDLEEYGYLFVAGHWMWIDGWTKDELSGSRTLHSITASSVAEGLPDGDAHSMPVHV